jgi:hypothetical protein
MMSNNKILTVSYGTFSCTLEGFDDSFGTMKAIAEYFRDLASDDRYFGAEPPQSDAEMLTRIAQKEISRRVEVREHEGKLVLSAHDLAEVDPAPSATMAAPQTNLQAEAMIVAEAARAAQAQAEAAAESARIEAEAEAKALTSAKAARLEEANQEAERLATAEAEAAEQADADRLAIEAAAAKAADVAPAPRDLAAEMPEADAFFSDPEVNATEVVIAEPVEEISAPLAQDDSIAAKLQRIRAVVSQADHAADDADFSEDQHADDLDTEEEVAPTSHTDDFDISSFSVDTEENGPSILEAVETETQEDVKASALADILEASAVDDAAEAPAEIKPLEDDGDDLSDILARLAADDDDTAKNEPVAKEIAPVEAAVEENLFDDTTYNDDEASLDDADEEEVAVAPRRVARVIKVKRADLEAAIAEGNLEEISSTLSASEEDELASDLAAAEAEADDAETLFEDETFEDEKTPGIEALRSIDDHEGDDLSRLMAEADQHMDEEEGKQSRDAFAHLRAAVAQKNADSGLADPTAEEEGAYRSDLATVVKPRHPVSAAKTSRPVAIERPAPLKLVAEQRVDEIAPAASTPIRPRCVAKVVEVEQTNEVGGTFVEFAEEMGVTELPELLEAAAAYLSFVHGHDQFSRPQLMQQVRTVEKQNFNREDGLCTFGQLLRAGKIEKTKGGRFTVTNEIGFRPDEREAG